MNKHQIYIHVGDLLRNKYRVISHLASGGMSEVYVIEEIDNKQNRWVAKVANLSGKFASKIVNEAKLLSKLNHPNLPFVVDIFSTEEYFFLVLEYIEGIPLSDYIETHDFELSIPFILNIGVQLCDILQYLHHDQPEPIIYRDIKPGNIIIMDNNTIKLIDFGIARQFQEEQMKDTVQIGTIGFAAPEQFEKIQSDTRTDLFSLGALLYYLLSKGKYVYITQKSIQSLRPEIPKVLSLCINELVKLKKDDRIQHVSKAKQLLLDATEQWEIDQQRERLEQEQDRHEWLQSKILHIVIVIGVTIIFVIGLIIFLIISI